MKADFCITVEFKKGQEAPERIYRTMAALLEALPSVDKILLGAVDSSIEPVLTLEDIEVGSIKTWLSQLLKKIPDDSLHNLDWKKQ